MRVRCNSVKEGSETVIPATGEHSWGDWMTTTEATYTEEGEQTRKCSLCGTEEKRPVPKLTAGWKKDGNYWYYIKADGEKATGWQKISNVWYYFNSSGAMVTGWQKISNVWYYFNSSGAMVTGTQTIGGKQYTFNSNGAWTGK